MKSTKTSSELTKFKTWQQALDYTFKTRHEWRHGNGAKTSRINANHFTRLRGSSFPLAKINQANMTQVGLELEEEGKSDATINRVISAVSTVLNHCALDGLADTAPSFRRRKEGEGRLVYFTKDEVNRMTHLAVDVFDRQDLADIIRFVAYTGMRQGEILKLRAKDIDLVDNKIHVGGVPTQVTKAKNHRAVPIHDCLQDIVRSRISQSSNKAIRIFGDEWGNKDQLLRAFKKVRNLVPKDEEYCFHGLRHSYATWLGQAGVPLRTIMALCGHARVETTLRYCKITDSALEAGINAL